MKWAANFQQISARYDALSMRERIIVAALAAVLLIVVVQWLLIEPLLSLTNTQQQSATQLASQIVGLESEMKLIQERKKSDPNQKENAALARLKQQELELDKQLRTRMKGLIEPAQMASVLEQVLSQKTPLELYQVRSLAPEPLLPEDQREQSAEGNEEQVQESGIYRHGMKIEFRGSYLSTQGYLQALEKLPWDFYWDGVELEVVHYPQSKVVITVHTLSLREGWIGV